MAGALALAALAGCSGSEGRNLAPSAGPVTAAPPGTGGAAPVPSVTAPPPVTGVPGLDSRDAFCAAWSRFAGSFQVVAVAAAFAEDPSEAFVLETEAAPLVADAYRTLGAEWPAELRAERDTVLTYVLGGFASRSQRVVQALTAAGASDAMLVEIGDAWLDALARRDPEAATLEVRLSDSARAIVDAAAASFAASAVPVNTDPALVSDAPTPGLDAYLAANCPDEGLLAGNEVG